MCCENFTRFVGGVVWVVVVDIGYGGGSDVGRSFGDYVMVSS